MAVLSLPLFLVLLMMLVAWTVSRIERRRLRFAMVALAMLAVAAGTGMLIMVLTRFSYNAWYGGATSRLISTSLHQIEEGNLDRVLTVWRGLDRQYQPTYENRAHYDELVEEAVERLEEKTAIKSGSRWDATVFKAETWVGHWENDTGFWFIFDDSGDPLDVEPSGQPRDPIHAVTLSPDYTVLTFKEGERWLHTLTLINKYEARHEWRYQDGSGIWNTDTLHKLVRATPQQKQKTQQSPPTTRPEE